MTRLPLKRVKSTLYLVFFLSLLTISTMALMIPSRPKFHLQAQDQATPGPSPTIDRLAAPPTVESPGPADLGAQAYWLNCQPCHGDQGQGLTEEWRNQYPEEDRGCWNSGCHGNRPYENGFTLPKSVPAIVGDGTLTKFESAANLHGYIKAAMPYNAPNTLSDEDYLNITAFLVREHNIQTLGSEFLSADNLNEIALYAQIEATSTAVESTPTPIPSVTPAPVKPLEVQDEHEFNLAMLIGVGVILILISGITLAVRRKPKDDLKSSISE